MLSKLRSCKHCINKNNVVNTFKTPEDSGQALHAVPRVHLTPTFTVKHAVSRDFMLPPKGLCGRCSTNQSCPDSTQSTFMAFTSLKMLGSESALEC